MHMRMPEHERLEITMSNGHTHIIYGGMHYEENRRWIRYRSESLDKTKKFYVKLRKKYIAIRTLTSDIEKMGVTS